MSAVSPTTESSDARRALGAVALVATLLLAVAGVRGLEPSGPLRAAGGASVPGRELDVVEMAGSLGARIAAPGTAVLGAGGAGGRDAAAEQQPEVAAGDTDRAGGPARVYVVAPGDTLSQIADRHGLSTAAVARANSLGDGRRLRAGQRIVLPDPDAPSPTTPAEAMAGSGDVGRVLEEVAAEFGWRPATVKAVAWAESRWNNRLVSEAGAVGIMQVLPSTGRDMAERLGTELDLHDPADNVRAGVAYLDLLHRRQRGDFAATLAAYHQGATSVRREGIHPSSRRYIAEVQRWRRAFGS